MEETLSLVKELAAQIISVVEKSGAVNNYWAMPIEKLNLSARAYNCLCRRDIKFVEQLIWFSKSDMLRIRNMGHSTFNEINAKIMAIGLKGW